MMTDSDLTKQAEALYQDLIGDLGTPWGPRILSALHAAREAGDTDGYKRGWKDAESAMGGGKCRRCGGAGTTFVDGILVDCGDCRRSLPPASAEPATDAVVINVPCDLCGEPFAYPFGYKIVDGKLRHQRCPSPPPATASELHLCPQCGEKYTFKMATFCSDACVRDYAESRATAAEKRAEEAEKERDEVRALKQVLVDDRQRIVDMMDEAESALSACEAGAASLKEALEAIASECHYDDDTLERRCRAAINNTDAGSRVAAELAALREVERAAREDFKLIDGVTYGPIRLFAALAALDAARKGGG